MPKIAIIDDEEIIANTLARVFKLQGHETEVFTNSNTAVKELEKGKFDFALIDLFMDGLNGGDIIKILKEKKIQTKCSIMTAHTDSAIHKELLDQGAIQVIVKPFEDIMKVPNQLLLND